MPETDAAFAKRFRHFFCRKRSMLSAVKFYNKIYEGKSFFNLMSSGRGFKWILIT
ncbi:hypothetical protein Cst_c20470 [Thermoclostridium stercorarium subsp. stercorarium DSM 8532]|uniref:Uncharacterized protein n=1 Tax=Thermoclostridium stercorarium (strain ATCC 35414 / DSM 8532 / NCIMB 11754) TaxID=1121335 RepID=L7VLG0_THES1|nr:hypothetical protein Cst_c20470 [Thermoclostridium stercorarium subsp. stercorarium DSM 8532]